MYGLPPDVDVSFFVGAMLIQVAIGQFEVNLHFDPIPIPLSVTVESAARLTSPTGNSQATDVAPELGTAAVALLGKSVTAAVGRSDGTLELAWSDGSVLEILDSKERYESYQINHGQRIIVV